MNNLKEVLLSPFLESFESMGTGKHSVSSKGRDLSNWASFGYYTGWLLHCDWSEKRRMEELLEDALSRVEIPELKKRSWRMEWIQASNVDCNPSRRLDRMDQWIESPVFSRRLRTSIVTQPGTQAG